MKLLNTNLHFKTAPFGAIFFIPYLFLIKNLSNHKTIVVNTFLKLKIKLLSSYAAY